MTSAARTAWLDPAPLDPAGILRLVDGDPALPGRALFTGTVRDDPRIREVVALDYEAYPDLAEREMRAICTEAAAAFGARCVMVHRTGRVGVGEPSVAAAASSSTDGAAIAACEWMVDQLKSRVPIWKEQRFADGGTEWAEGA